MAVALVTLLHALCTFVYTWVQLGLSASNVRARFHFGVSAASRIFFYFDLNAMQRWQDK
jgi:hypothetical protein